MATTVVVSEEGDGGLGWGRKTKNGLSNGIEFRFLSNEYCLLLFYYFFLFK